MVTNFKGNQLILLFVLLVYTGCNSGENSELTQNDPPHKTSIDSSENSTINILTKMDQVQLYCFCYYYIIQPDTLQLRKFTGSTCTTPFGGLSSALIRHELLHATSRDSMKLNVLYRFLGDSNNITNKERGSNDARFAILFTNKNKDSVLFSPLDNYRLVLNDATCYTYRFQIMDTVLKYLNLKEVNCK